MKCAGSFTTEVITFDNVNEIVNWMKQGNEVRAVIGDGELCVVRQSGDGFMAVAMTDEDYEGTFLTKDDLDDLLDAGDIIGVFYNGETDGNYNRFGIEI